jgi:hypothetical protein
MYKGISICGAPLVGKTEILRRLSKLTGPRKPSWKGRLDRYACLRIANELCKVKVRSFTGSIFYRDEAYSYLLSRADIVVYVFSPDMESSFQSKIFEHYIRIAKELNKFWTDIPWIFVFNKVDRGSKFPDIKQAPDNLEELLIRTIAYKGIGIDLLWKRILSHVVH